MDSDKNNLQSEAGISIGITTFLGTVSLFFAGLLMSRLNSFAKSIRIPILFLIVATFAFVFSSIIYAKTSGAMRLAQHKVESYIKVGNAVSEFLGLYPFVIAIPMVVNAITSDEFLRLSTFIIMLISITLYSLSDFSMLRRKFTRGTTGVITGLIDIGAVITFSFQHAGNVAFDISSIAVLLFLTLIAVMCIKKV